MNAFSSPDSSALPIAALPFRTSGDGASRRSTPNAFDSIFSMFHLAHHSITSRPLRGLGLFVALLLGSLAAPSAMEAAPKTMAWLQLLPWLVIVGAGLVSGFLAGLLGIGGALITIPTFYFVLPRLGVGAAQLSAAVIGSALMAMAPTTVAAALRQADHGALDFGWIKRLAPTMAIGAVGGAAFASQVQGPLLSWAFAVQSLYYGVRLIVDRLDDGGASPRGLTRSLSQLPTWLAGSTMAGFVAAVGMGGASVVAPFLRHRGLGLRPAVATASALNLCIAFGGSGAFLAAAISGSGPAGIHYPAALLMGAAAVAAVPFGVTLAHRLPISTFRTLIGAINVFAAVILTAQLLGR